MVHYTVIDIIAEDPCKKRYPIGRLEELRGDRDALTAREISELDIQLDDIAWILSRLLYRQSPWRANRIAREIVLDVADCWDMPDIAWHYLVTGDELIRDAARSAARSAAWDAARSAARSASRDSAWAAARDSAWAAARSASRDSAWAAARDSAMRRYINMMLRGWEV